MERLQRYQALLIQVQNQISLPFSLPYKSNKPPPSQRALKPGSGASACLYELPRRDVFQAHQSAVCSLMKGLPPPSHWILLIFSTPRQSVVIHKQSTSHSSLNTAGPEISTEVGKGPLLPGGENLVRNSKSKAATQLKAMDEPGRMTWLGDHCLPLEINKVQPQSDAEHFQVQG